MWTNTECDSNSDYAIYFDTVMTETIGVFKEGEKLDLVIEGTENNGYYILKEYDDDGNVVREQKVKLTACE